MSSAPGLSLVMSLHSIPESQQAGGAGETYPWWARPPADASLVEQPTGGPADHS